MVFDLETTGLDQNAEILQIASSRPDSIVRLERYLLPDTRTLPPKCIVLVCRTEMVLRSYKRIGKIWGLTDKDSHLQNSDGR